jgi:hypothetical protein|tara:strand:- start:2918 stop:3187 length:270 start_codon:yes stop_codon:yes gene_type:complete
MGYYTNTVKPIGNFIEKDYGNNFEYSLNPDNMAFCEDHPHVVWVGDQIGSPYRYATVKKTVAYVVVDEDEFGLPVVEKWAIKGHASYAL